MERNKERSGDIIIKVIKWTQNEIGREPRIGSHVTNEIKSNNDKKKIMKQFSLEEFKKNQNRKVVTRDGKVVKILYTDARRDYSIIALVEREVGRDYLFSFLPDGTMYGDRESVNDLFFSDEQSSATMKEGWITLYSSSVSSNLLLPACYVMTTKENAEKHAEKHPKDFVAIAKVTWE